MKLFLVCPQCTHFFESTSTQLIENAGRVECPTCEYLFDGYAHYRFDGVDADQAMKKRSHVSSKASTKKKSEVDVSGLDNLAQSVETQSLASHIGATQISRVPGDSNLYEAVFAPLPKKKSIWQLANIILCMIFGILMAINFNKQILVNIPQGSDWAQQLCERIGCEFRGARRLSELRLVGTDLVMRPDIGKNAYQFRATIQNLGAEQLELPAIELKLSDIQGRVITSRVIYPIQYGGDVVDLELGTKMEYQVNLLLRVGEGLPVAFDSYLFYPKESKT
jgi:hypothetical protein